jgi:signal transduction histidine kinase
VGGGLRAARWMLFLAAAAACHALADDHVEPWRVVIIRNWDALYPVNLVREGALRQALVEGAPRGVEVYPEHLDPLRFPTGLVPEMVPVLRSKYSDLRIDVIIASGWEPLQFATQYRDTIWPNAAIVFNGVVEGTLDGWKRPARTTGVTMELDVLGTLRTALALVPRARNVYFVAGVADFDRMFLDLAKRDFGRLDRPLEAHYLVGLTRAEALRRVAELGPDSIVVYLTMLRDGGGQVSSPGGEGVARFAAVSRAPVFSAVHSQWGRGPVGGSSSRFDEHGREAGRLVRRVLEGEDAEKLPVAALPRASCEVDWRRLQHWSLAARNVPARCDLVHQAETGWRANFWPVLALFLLVLGEGVLIWMLVLQSRRRRIAEERLRARGAELAQVARLSMMGALTASIAHEINQPMGAILSNAEAAEMMLARGELKPDKLREILADIRREDLRASHVITSLRKLLAQRETRPMALEVNGEVAEALGHVAFEAARRGVALLPEFHNDLPAVLADPVQLQQVVINLAMNAIEAVSSEPERLREVRVSTRACPNGVEIVVADRGPGVTPGDDERLFNSMFTTKKDGMGLGLSIVRAIVEAFGGRVSFESNVPRGAIFRVWLPAIGR